jgi:hypothetical protein
MSRVGHQNINNSLIYIDNYLNGREPDPGRAEAEAGALAVPRGDSADESRLLPSQDREPPNEVRTT